MLAGIIFFTTSSMLYIELCFLNVSSFHYVRVSMIYFNFKKAVWRLYFLGGSYVHFLCSLMTHLIMDMKLVDFVCG